MTPWARPVTTWPRRGPWWARLRRWAWYRLAGYDSETCDACGRRVRLSWWASSSDMWQAAYARATGEALGSSGILCTDCFARFAPVAIMWVASPLTVESERG